VRSEAETLYEALTEALSGIDDIVVQSVRVPLFFHLVGSQLHPRRWQAKRLLYPMWMAARSIRASRYLPNAAERRASNKGDVLFIVENETMAGLGTLLPLINTPRIPSATVLVTDRVARTASRLAGRIHHRSWLRFGESGSLVAQDRMISGRSGLVIDLLRSKGLGNEARRLGSVLRVLLQQASALHAVLTKYLQGTKGVRCIVTHNDFMPATFLAVVLARRLGLEEATLQHGMPVLEYAPIVSGRYLVWGEEAFRWFIARGARPSALKVTGCPRMDPLFAAAPDLGASGSRKTLVVVSQTHSPACEPSEHERFVRALVDAVAILGPTWRIVVKLHPLEGRSLYRRVMAGRTPPNWSFTKSANLWKLLRESSAVVGLCSTAMIEAMIASRPVLVFGAPGERSRTYGSGLEDTMVVDGRQLAAVAGRLLSDAPFASKVVGLQKARLDGLFAFKGRSTDEVTRELGASR
jgi:hypothetical protein